MYRWGGCVSILRSLPHDFLVYSLLGTILPLVTGNGSKSLSLSQTSSLMIFSKSNLYLLFVFLDLGHFSSTSSFVISNHCQPFFQLIFACSKSSISLVINLRLQISSKSHQVTLRITDHFVFSLSFVSKMLISEINLLSRDFFEGKEGTFKPVPWTKFVSVFWQPDCLIQWWVKGRTTWLKSSKGVCFLSPKSWVHFQWPKTLFVLLWVHP